MTSDRHAPTPPAPLAVGSSHPLGVVLARALVAQGVGQVFTIPGDFVLPLVAVLEADGSLPLVTMSHEPALGYAADAAARATGRPSAALVTYGAGALNLINAAANAYSEMSPVVFISGAPSRDERAPGRIVHHQARTIDSQRRIFEEVTCDHAVLDDPLTAPDAIARVLQSCVGRSRPVYLEIPRDLADRPVVVPGPMAPSPAPTDALDACADAFAAAIMSARAPVLLVGAEVRRRGAELAIAHLARALAAPIVTSFMGRGVMGAIPEVTFLGTWHGAAGSPRAAEAVSGSDLVVHLGVIPSDTNLGPIVGGSSPARLAVAHDGRATLDGRAYAPVPLAALVKAVLLRVARRGSVPSSEAPPPRGPVVAARPPGDALGPDDVADALNAAFERDGVAPLICDTGDALFLATRIDHRALLAPACYATMGFAVPAAMGLQIATGERPIALLGDGAFHMTGLELSDCARLGCDPIVIVLNNASWETIRVFHRGGADRVESSIHAREPRDLAALARAMGGDGWRVRSRRDLTAALRHAFRRRGRFQLLDVRLPRGAVTSALSTFAGALGGPGGAQAA